MAKKSIITVKDVNIRTMTVNGIDYICINAVLINDGMPQGERLVKLNQIAIQQMKILEDNDGRKLLK